MIRSNNESKAGVAIGTGFDYLAINRSRLTFPGPVISNTKNATRYNPAASPFPKKSPPIAENKATDIAINSGIQANLVNKPSIINAAQKNSAKTTRANDVVEPR
jgi:hypothetical protein